MTSVFFRSGYLNRCILNLFFNSPGIWSEYSISDKFDLAEIKPKNNTEDKENQTKIWFWWTFRGLYYLVLRCPFQQDRLLGWWVMSVNADAELTSEIVSQRSIWPNVNKFGYLVWFLIVRVCKSTLQKFGYESGPFKWVGVWIGRFPR